MFLTGVIMPISLFELCRRQLGERGAL